MRSILISIKPEWVEKILNGNKTAEIRKSMPKCKLPCKVYIYCSQGQPDLRMFNQEICERFNISKNRLYSSKERKNYTKFIGDNSQSLNGKVVAEFTLNKIDLLVDMGFGIHYIDKNLKDLDLSYLKMNSCLTDEQIYFYLGLKKDSGYYNDGYVWYIDDLVIYNKPKELSEFSTLTKCNSHIAKSKLCDCCCLCSNFCKTKPKKLTRPPQSWCYVEGE